MDIRDRNIIITGASSGIGLQLLNSLSLYSGVRIIAAARHIQNIPVKEGVIIPFAADLTQKEDVDRLFGFSDTVFNTIDIFIACAGFAYTERLNNADWQHIEQIYALNVISPVYSLQKQVEYNGNKGKSFFVCISSAVATVPLPYYSLYCSTKAAIRQFMKTYRFEKQADTHIMTVYPIATRTVFFAKAGNNKALPLPFPTQSPMTVAKSIVKGIEKDRISVSPSFLFRIFEYCGHIFPFIFTIYSLNEKRKIKKHL